MNCIGFGPFEGCCEREATSPGGIFCAWCAHARVLAIKARLERAGARVRELVAP